MTREDAAEWLRERAAIREYCGEMSRADAEAAARAEFRELHHNKCLTPPTTRAMICPEG